MMTVNLHERGLPDMRKRRMRCNLVNELGEEERLPAEPLRGVVLREEARQFVAKRADASRLQADDGGARLDFGAQGGHGPTPQAHRRVEHAPIVQRTTATERAIGDNDAEAEILEDVRRGD